VFYYTSILTPNCVVYLAIVTNGVSEEGIIHSGVTVRLCVCFQSNFWTARPLPLRFCMFIGHDDSSLGIENQGQGLCPSPRLRRSPIVGWGRGPPSPFRTLAHRASPLFKTFHRPWAKRQARKMTTIIRPLDSAIGVWSLWSCLWISDWTLWPRLHYSSISCGFVVSLSCQCHL